MCLTVRKTLITVIDGRKYVPKDSALFTSYHLATNSTDIYIPLLLAPSITPSDANLLKANIVPEDP